MLFNRHSTEIKELTQAISQMAERNYEFIQTDRKALDDKLTIMTDNINRLISHSENISVKHENLQGDHKSLQNRVNNTEADIHHMQTQLSRLDILCHSSERHSDMIGTLTQKSTQIDTIAKLVQWGGMGILLLFVSAWTNMNTKIENATLKNDQNAIAISELVKDSDEHTAKIADLHERVTHNRETILGVKDDK